MHRFLIAIFTSLLPQSMRERFVSDSDMNVKSGAIISGIAQFVGSAAALFFRYPAFIQAKIAASETAFRAAAKGDQGAAATGAFVGGVFGIYEYLLTPVTLFFAYWFIEGAVRLMAAVATSEIIPTLPLKLVELAQRGVSHSAHETWLGPRVEDVVQWGDGSRFDLRIESSREKDWPPTLTISYEEKLFEVADAAQQKPPRRFVYLLRTIPPTKLVRGLHNYSPDETVLKTGREKP